MQGGTLTSETLAQYSALMVMKHMYGPDKIRRFLKYELDSYLRSRQAKRSRKCRSSASRTSSTSTTARARSPCTCCRSGSAKTRSTARSPRFLAKWRFKGPPYPRSLDLIDEFRKEAKTPEQQQLITDLFEKITLYDLKVADAATSKDADGWTTTLTVKADKFYASGKGVETKTKLAEPIEIGLFTARPGPRRFLGEGCDRDGAQADRAAAPSRSSSTARRSRRSRASIPIISTSTETATTM